MPGTSVPTRKPRKRRWARDRDRCRKCRRSSQPHAGDGLCAPCKKAQQPKKRWSLERDRCKKCRRKSKPHAGRGLCTSCYGVWKRLNPDAPRRNTPVKRRVRDGQEEFLCKRCERWFVREFFYAKKKKNDRDKSFGIIACCKWCHKTRQQEYHKTYKATRNRLARRRSLRERIEDSLHEGLIEPFDKVPTADVKRWMELAGERLPEDCRERQHLGMATGVDLRRLYDIENLRTETTKFDIAERIARAAGCHDELYAMMPQDGKEGWGPNGETACLRCGAWWRRYHAKGMCAPCYKNVWFHTNRGHPVPNPVGSWAMFYARCQICGTTKKRHQGKGLCTSCWSRERKRSRTAGYSLADWIAAGRCIGYGLEGRGLHGVPEVIHLQ